MDQNSFFYQGQRIWRSGRRKQRHIHTIIGNRPTKTKQQRLPTTITQIKTHSDSDTPQNSQQAQVYNSPLGINRMNNKELERVKQSDECIDLFSGNEHTMNDHYSNSDNKHVLSLNKCEICVNMCNCKDGRQRKTTVSNLSQDATLSPSGYTILQTHETAHNTTRHNENITLATWNVRTLHQDGKLENLIQEANKLKLAVTGVTETRWTGVGKCKLDNYEFIYSGGNTHERGVGILFDKDTSKSILGYWGVSDRILLVKLKGCTFNINLIQAYAPTSESTKEDLDSFYSQLMLAKKQCKSQEITIIMGDFNAKVGNEPVENIVGKYGLGEQNERGELLIDWCRNEKYLISNTWFKNHPKNLWTWQHPNKIHKNQIDFILVPQRFRNLVKNAKTIPSADINSDHRPVKCIVKLRLKRIIKSKPKPKLQIELLREDENIREIYKNQVKEQYGKMNETENIEEEWSNISKCIAEPVKEIIPVKSCKSKSKWITPEILNLMEERSKIPKNTNEYKEADRRIKRACTSAKQQYINTECQKVENLKNKNSKKFHESIENLTGRKANRSQSKSVKDSNGNLIMNTEDILKRWAEYIEQLYSDKTRGDFVVNTNKDNEYDRQILKDEVRSACKEMKASKAVGLDNICIEMINALGEFGIDILTKAFNTIYEKGIVPNELRKSTFITIPKKPGTVECDQHRTICIMSQVTKILLRIVMKRMRNKISQEIGKHQFGFVKDKGTVNAIYTLKTVMQRLSEKQKLVYLCFIDYSKAFDSVQHSTLFQMLVDIGIDYKDICLVKDLYWHQSASVKVDDETSNFFNITKGVRQGCVLSPDLFNLYSEHIFREIEDFEGISVGGVNINNLRYADDAVLMAYSSENLQKMLDELVDKSEKKGLLLNVKKTECMVVGKDSTDIPFKITSKGETIKQVKQFKYLGSNISNDCKDTSEIKQRIAIAKQTFNNLKPAITNTKIQMSTKMQMTQTYVFPTLLYGCETWTIDAESKKRLEAFEMWVFRRLLKIPWTALINNQEVLRRIGKDRTLIDTIRRRQMKFFGHIWRGDGIEKLVTSGYVEGKRARGGQRMTFLKNLRQNTSSITTNTEYARYTTDRQTWRRMVGNAPERARHTDR